MSGNFFSGIKVSRAARGLGDSGNSLETPQRKRASSVAMGESPDFFFSRVTAGLRVPLELRQVSSGLESKHDVAWKEKSSPCGVRDLSVALQFVQSSYWAFVIGRERLRLPLQC